MTGIGVLLILGGAFESLFVVGVLPLSMLVPAPLFTLVPLGLMAILTPLAGIWLVLKGLRGIGDMVVTAQSLVLPVRSVIQIVRGTANRIPLDCIISARTIANPAPGRLEIRYRLADGRERRRVISMGFVPDADALQSELGLRGIHLAQDSQESRGGGA